MSKINLENHITVTSSNQVAEICKPFFDQFGLNYFTYGKIRKEQESHFLTSNSLLVESVSNKKLNVANNVKKSLKKGYYFWAQYSTKLTNNASKKAQLQIAHARENFNIDHCFTIIEQKDQQYIEIFAPYL